jgi:predicted DNA-binding ribbon-helix-helix protein
MPRSANVRNVSLRGKRTSVSLEPEFWEAIETIARHKLVSIDVVLNEIDMLRPKSPQGRSVATFSESARLYVVRYFLAILRRKTS